jgi:hypothetical protein
MFHQELANREIVQILQERAYRIVRCRRSARMLKLVLMTEGMPVSLWHR